jgi:hypothetical protein
MMLKIMLILMFFPFVLMWWAFKLVVKTILWVLAILGIIDWIF